MSDSFTTPVPEIPVTDIDAAADYYEQRLGFNVDWRDEGGGGIGGVSKGHRRLFLTNHAFRETHGNSDYSVRRARQYPGRRAWCANAITMLSSPRSRITMS